MDKKRKFRITLNESRAEGAELKIGTVSVEFVKYWQERDGLIEHLESIADGEEGDANSPPMRDGKNFPWYECDYIEGILSPYDRSRENGFKVEEITAKGDVIIEKQLTDVVSVYSRERYVNPINMDDENSDRDVSVLIFLSGERGCDNWLVETDGEDFNPKKLAYGALETYFGEFVDAVFYDKKELELEIESGTESTAHRDASVGVIGSSWIKDQSKANTLKNLEWDYYDELLKEK